MLSMSARKKYSLIPGWILILAIVALGVIQSGNPANLVDPSGFLFVMVGGIALVMISFLGSEIRRALPDAAGAPANEVDIRGSALTALLGLVLVGAPLEDHAIRAGRV